MNLINVIFAINIISVTSLAHGRQLQSHWNKYKVRHRKLFANAIEENKRFNIWSQRKDIIDKHNLEADLGLHSYTMETNVFSDKDDSELKSMLGNVLPKSVLRGPRTDFIDFSSERQPPPSLDYRDDPCLAPIKNQGTCGSCWAFTSVALTEFQACKKTGTLKILSEQQLIDCSDSNWGCYGGYYTAAWSDCKAKGGVMTSAAYPYKGTDNVCSFKAADVTAKVASYAQLTAKNPMTMMKALTKGPIAVSMNVVSSFYNYQSGVYADPKCNSKSMEDINHAVVIVGYGTYKGIPHWIVRNSWGNQWGMSGYVFIKRGVNQCNIESWPATMMVA